MSTGDRSLRSLFDECQSLYQGITESSLPSTDEKYQGDVERALALCEDCAKLVRALSIFSSNELLEDINTTDLRFLLLDFYGGELQLLRMTSNRIEQLKQAKVHLESFLMTCDQLAILRPEDKKFMDSELSKKPKDAAQQRNEKIARFKRQKAATEKLKELNEIVRKASAQSNGVDEELDRDVLVTMLDISIHKAVESLSVARDELELLEKFAATKIDNQNREKENSERVDMKQEKPKSLLSKDGKPLQPFIITNKRQELQAGVFRYGHNLPTMTIDQFLENEIARGNFLSGGTEMPKKPDIDDNDEAALDAATMKAREMDDFKEANPRGWGNRMNKG